MLRITISHKPPREVQATFAPAEGFVLIESGRKKVFLDLTQWDEVRGALLSADHEDWADILHQSLVSGNPTPAELGALRALLLLAPSAEEASRWIAEPGLSAVLAGRWSDRAFVVQGPAAYQVAVLHAHAAAAQEGALTELMAAGLAFRLQVQNDWVTYSTGLSGPDGDTAGLSAEALALQGSLERLLQQ
jgi:hypothetical protein